MVNTQGRRWDEYGRYTRSPLGRIQSLYEVAAGIDVALGIVWSTHKVAAGTSMFGTQGRRWEKYESGRYTRLPLGKVRSLHEVAAGIDRWK